MLRTSRRQVIIAALSAVALRGGQRAHAGDPPPLGARELWRPRQASLCVNDFVVLLDGSIAVRAISWNLPLVGAAYLLDPDGRERWGTQLGSHDELDMIPSLAAARGNDPPGMYVAAGFKTISRLAADGTVTWETDVFEEIGLTTQLAMASHPDGGVILSGHAHPPDGFPSCDDGLLLRLDGNGRILWHWRCAELGHFYPTALAATGNGTTIALLTNYDPFAFGSQGDICASELSPQRTVWFGPTGNLLRTYEWPDDRRAEAMAFDRQGRLVFFGLTKPEAWSFFQVVDAEGGELIFETVQGDGDPGFLRRDRPIAWRRRLRLSDRGVSLINTNCDESPCGPAGATIITLAADGRVSEFSVPERAGHAPAIRPDASSLIAAVDGRLFDIALDWP